MIFGKGIWGDAFFVERLSLASSLQSKRVTDDMAVRAASSLRRLRIAESASFGHLGLLYETGVYRKDPGVERCKPT